MKTQRSCRGHKRRVLAADSPFIKNAVRRGGLVLCLAAGVGFGLTGCGASKGGDNGHNPTYQTQLDTDSGLLFSYPFNGQQDVTPTTQIVLRADTAFGGDASNAFVLQSADGNASRNVSTTVTEDSNQPGIYRIDTSQPLAGDTTYRVVAARDLKGNNTAFAAGATLFQFTTAPTAGHPAKGNFRVTQAAPGDVNPVTGRKSVFAQFDTVYVALSGSVDPATVIDGSSFKFTNAAGDEVKGTLTSSGHNITFDPSSNLAPGTYTLSLSSNVKSVFGKSLQAYSTQRTVLDSGKIVQQNLLVDNDQGFSGDTNDSPLDGQSDNLVTLRDQLIGTNQQPARTKPEREGVLVNLSQPGMPGFGNEFPNSIPAGQTFELKPLDLKLDGKIETPVHSGPIEVQFGSDANVYLEANDYRSLVTPTAVRLRFDLNNTTLISAAPGTPDYIVQALANGAINQSALNVQASGLAFPQKNGDLLISTVGSFPLKVNRTDTLTVDFSLTLRLPASQQTPVQKDTTAPFLTAQVPSACFYVAGTPAYDSTYAQAGASPIALPEQQCVGVLQAGGAAETASGIDSAALDGDIGLTFSEPLNPLTVNSQNIQLTGNGSSVPVSLTTDGSSVTIHPEQTLAPDTQYTVTLNDSGLTDLAGNSVTQVAGGGPGQTITFTTEPMVDNASTQKAPVLLGELSPGLPCAVTGGNFASGGNTVGYCVGDSPQSGNPQAYPVSDSPMNVPVDAFFSKPVEKSSVVLANGCLTGSSNGADNTNANATVALETVNGNGQCTGVAPASLAFSDANSDTAEGFSIRPVGELVSGQRYWVVICGTERGTPATSCSSQITDIDGLALNTDPLSGSGSTPQSSGAADAGGPDIVVPFDATGYSADYYADQFTLPATDTNGNGQFDDANGNGQYNAGGTDERPQPANRTLVDLTLAGVKVSNPNRSDGDYPTYSALDRPIVIGSATNNCAAVQQITNNSGTSAIGTSTTQCIPVSLLPGGINDLTAIKVGASAVLSVLPQVVTNLLGNLVDQGILGVNTPLGPALNAVGKSLNNVLGPILTGATSSGSTGSSNSGGTGNTGSTGGSSSTGGGNNGGGLLGAVGQGVGSILGGVNSATGTNANGGSGNGGNGSGNKGGAISTVGDLLNGSLGDVDSILGNAANGNGAVSAALQPLQTIVQALQQVLMGLVDPEGNIANTGRVVLRYPELAANGASATAQTGYIVPECKGSQNGANYDYSPCFVAHINLIANAPDATGLTFPQQRITANVIGPVTFEQNGRLVIPLQNANQIQLTATAAGLFPTTATIQPGTLHLQLVGDSPHGGVAFPER